MSFPTMDAITEKFTGQPYNLNSVLSPDGVWAKMDAPPEQVRAALNVLITALNAVTASANIGFSPNEDVDPEAKTVQTAFDSLVAILHGTGGASWLKSIGVEGLTGDNVQAILESLKQYVDDNSPVLQGSVHDQFLGNDSGDIKQRFSTHLAESAIRVMPNGSDDTDSFKAAISQINTAGAGAIWLKPFGSYQISDQLVLPNNILIIGNNATISINRLNWTGGIPRFYALFTTINVTERPQDAYFRLGTGIISHSNISIKDLTLTLHRDPSVLTADQMLIAEFNVVRFEDAENCIVKNCRVIDLMDSTLNNGGHVVQIVRSKRCTVEGCYFEKCTGIEVQESENCNILFNENIGSIGTAIETMAGSGHTIEKNHIDLTIWNGSVIGVNSVRCKVLSNIIDKAAMTGITLGHDEPTNATTLYGIPAKCDYTVCDGNVILSGDSVTSGKTGILMQNGSHVRILNNHISDLVKSGAYTDYCAGILINGGGVVDRFTDIIIKGNSVSTATNGIMLDDGEDVVISENYVNDVLCGINQNMAGASPQLTIEKNFVSNADRAMNVQNGFVSISKNSFLTIANVAYSITLARGHYVYKENYSKNMGQIFFAWVKSLRFINNVIDNDVVADAVGNIYNNNIAETATIDKITVHDNIHDGTTNLLLASGVLGVTSGAYIEETSPKQYRNKSFNLGTLPTSATGLSAGDIWNNAGVVSVV